jgi:very-short-patch-repair endonuclease
VRSTSPADEAWHELLARQEGVLSRRQALASGMSGHAWSWRLTSERWSTLLPGVALSRPGAPTEAQLAWGAVLHCGEGAALTADLGLVVHGFRLGDQPDRIRVAVPEGRVVRRAAVRAGNRLVPVAAQQVRGLDGLRHPVKQPPVVKVAPAALHAAAHAPTERAAEWRIAAVVQQRLTTADRLARELQQMPKLRRRALIATVLGDVAEGAQAGSELAFLRFLRRHGLPEPDRLQRLVRANGKRYIDAGWDRQRVVAEIDGAHHMEVAQWGADVLRANAVVVAERHDRLLLLRFTTGNLRHDGDEVAEQLRAALLG